MSARRFFGGSLLPLAAATLLAALCPPAAAAADGNVEAILEMHTTHFPMGEPVEVRFSLWNPGGKEVKGLPEPPLTRYFELRDADGAKVPPAPGSGLDAPQAASLPPGGHYGLAFDLGDLYPRIRAGGTFRLFWKAGEIVSNQVVLKIVPAYDPARTYLAKIETTMGSMVMEFFPAKAPLAVRNFIELAQSGFYDDTPFYYVDAGRMIAGGDRGGMGTGTPGFTYPMEQNDLQMLAGTVGMKRAGVPPTNGSQFFILAAPRPEFNGLYTVFGQIVEGLDVVRRISEVPNSGRRTNPANRPLQDVRIRRITVTEKPTGSAAR